MGYLRAGGPVRVSVDPMSKAGPLGKRPKVTGHASGQARPWRTGESTGENQRPGVGAPLALPPRGERRHPRAPTEVCEAGASSVVLVPRIRAGPEPLAEGCSVSVCSVSSSRLAGASAETLRDPACRQALPGLCSSREVKATPNTPPARTEPWGPPAPPAPDPLSPDEGLSILRPQHGLTSFVHSDHVGAGGGPGHRVDGRAAKGEVGTRVRPR